jgi:nucleoside-diphosphate-sugar epimerase
MLKDKRVVVTGGSGFIGTHYIEELLNRGANVVTHTYESPLQTKDDRVEVIPNINLEKYDDTLKLIEGADYVVHSAGKICHPSNVSNDFQVALNYN